MDIADAGAQTAKAHLLGDKVPAHDVDNTSNANYLARLQHRNSDARFPGVHRGLIKSGENWSPEAGGQTRSFAGGQFVAIRWLNRCFTSRGAWLSGPLRKDRLISR